MGKQLGLNKQQASLSLTLELSLTLAAWLSTALLFSIISNSSMLPSGATESIVLILLLGLAGLVLATLVYYFSPKARGVCQELLALKTFDFKLIALVEVFLLYTGLCIFNGFCFYLVCSSLGIDSLSPAQAIAANSQAFLIGLFALVAPGGLGVREGSLTAILSTYTTVETALAAALLWRGVQLLVELLCLILVFIGYQANSALSSLSLGGGSYSKC